MRRLLLACALCLSACEASEAEAPIVYRDGPGGTLDVRVPDGDGPFAAVVFIHGGGWVKGDYTTYSDGVDLAVARGMVGVTINYRLADEGGDRARFPWPAQLQDVRCALRWLADNAAALHVDPRRVGALGESAGGQLSFMAAYARDEPRFEPTTCAHAGDVALKAVVSLAGVDDLATVYQATQWYLKAYITRWLGLPDGASVDVYAAAFADASPLSYLADGPHVPGLVLQGSADTTVPPLSQRTFVAAAASAGQDVTLEVLDGVDHAGITRRAVVARALDWLAARL